MSKSIDTLASDIYTVLDSTQHHDHEVELAEKYAERIGNEFIKATEQRIEPRQKGKLWASDIGKPCLRQHWYNFNAPEYASKLEGHTKFKFLYGNILEEAVLYYAEESGHTVEKAQERVEVAHPSGWAVSGRIDAVIDGTLIDVKSTSPYGFKQYKYGISPSNDKFGYIEQLSFYHRFKDFDVLNEDIGFVWIDKQNGHIAYTKVDKPPTKKTLEDRITKIVQAVDDEEQNVPKAFAPSPYGKSGNESLAVACSYCPYKKQCWRDANGGQGLRTFLYNQGPVDFTSIKREPKTVEIT